MKTVKIETVKDLKDLIKDLPENFPVGRYYANYWYPTLKQGHNMAILQNGLAVDIDCSYNY